MNLADYYSPGRLGLSFELFPPKTDKGDASLMLHVEKLVKFKPDYITCTYGAGGSTRGKTLDIVEKVKQVFGVPVASHLTLVESTVADLRLYLAEAERRGVDYIVALRGDPPQGEKKFKPVAKGLSYASELVELVKDEFQEFGVAVAGYPEKHLEAESLDVDIERLKHKVDCGADIVITQLFYRNQDFYEFREKCVAAGINVPIVPGIFPIVNGAQIQRIGTMCGAKIPRVLVEALQKKPDDTEYHMQIGVEYATRQIEELTEAGIPGLHFYVLNRSEATAAILANIRYAKSRT
ncbi:methylenetetrahydrofolate reductase [NAD(P)H] [Blastopirellula sp. JC732]|uniref:Methylenetetrahydrofolate reductase n=1 Tax=Blastopirellula sediminis TaxID=2894196 RepID=A0A9X1SLG1_9BACT|nr:methylenetetrahydrofolate reductase [NAD(P)H] [Blastopirellula sediminis]MCC9606027.1 methylenetetrahydrofolate reductase [NAD(P)H] [Blastopirellula sediminis]MCC9630674.1 methylenetetrahydrofolate reductase [NAD(P)H] [Blastopirellula sediminis]